MSILVCIPAFNEESVISKVIFTSLQHSDKVVVCDDGSTDNTVNVARSAGAYVIQQTKNKGKGEAMRMLFDFAKFVNYDVIVTIDGDGQFDPNEIPKLVKPILEKNADIVIGYRFDNQNSIPKYREIGNKFLDKITNLASDLPFRDTQSGFRAYSKSAIEKISFKTSGFGADAEILVDAAKKGLKIVEEKITVSYDTGAETSTKNPISHTSEVVGSLVELIALKSPLKVLGVPGLILIAIGVYFAIMTIGIFNDTRYFSLPFTLISFGTLAGGLMFTLMAILLFSISKTRN